MIISMKLHATREEIDEVRKQVEHFGYKVDSIEGDERVVIGVVGVGDVTGCMESIEAMPQVDNVVRISAPYKFVSKEFRPGKTRIKVNGTEIGGAEFVVMAGPCSVESEKQIMQAAEGVAKAGAKMLRGGAFKPRTSPYDFPGMEEEGLKLLKKAKEATHVPVILDPSHATGKRSLVPALSRAGVAIGADGLIVEVHPAPEKAISDGAQSLDIAQFQRMMKDLQPYIQLWHESRKTEIAAAAGR